MATELATRKMENPEVPRLYTKKPKAKGPISGQMRPLVDELRMLQKSNMRLAGVYASASGGFFRGACYPEFQTGHTLDVLAIYARRMAREAIYRELGIELKQSKEENGPKVSELIDSEALFNMVVHGNLKEQILEMAGVQNPSRVTIECLHAGSKTHRVMVIDEEREEELYIKERGVEPEVLAVELLSDMDMGIVIPEIRDVQCPLPNNETLKYGIMQKIDDVEGVKHAVSLRGLARNERLARLVIDNFNEFCEKLGSVFEICRMLGIQDRHSRNIYVIEKEDGTLALGLIDMDMVACYPKEQLWQEAFSSVLHTVLDDLDFALQYGSFVRSDPAWKKTEKSDSRIARDRRNSICIRMSKKFVSGAQKAQAFYVQRENQKQVLDIFKEHEGKPVGWGCTEEDMEERERLFEKPVINGSVQNLIRKGSDFGRFLFNALDAWKHGFEQQLSANLEKFWAMVFARSIEGATGTVVY